MRPQYVGSRSVDSEINYFIPHGAPSCKQKDLNGEPAFGDQPYSEFREKLRSHLDINLSVNLCENTALLIVVAKDIYDYV